MATSSSTWPVGFPARVIQTLGADTPSTFMQVPSGEDCKVISTRTVSNRPIACIELAAHGNNPGRTGWVPKSALSIGQTRKVGDITFDIGRPAAFPIGNLYKSKSDLTFTTIKNLLLSYHRHRQQLPVEPIYVRDRLDTEARQAYFADRLVKGIAKVSSKLMRILDSGDFDWKMLRDNSTNAANLGKEVGIYLIVHEGFAEKGREPEMYTGSTSENFQARNSKHRGSDGWGAEAPTSPHYRAAKRAQKHYHFPICYFDSDDTEKSDLKIAEQVFTDLFQTTCSAVLTMNSFSETNEDTDNTAADARRGLRSPEASNRAAKYVDDKEAANVLASNASKVFEATGWPGGVRRTKGKGRRPFGIGAGLNWSMPITEMRFEKQTWIMTRIPGRVANYRRVAYISKEDSKRNKGSKLIWQKNTVEKGDSNVAFFLTQSEEGPAHGTKVHVVVEVRLDNQSCGVPWSRQPTVGPWSDSFDATQVGMRIEWQNEHGNWVFKHLQCDYYNTLATNASKQTINGATTGYRVATGLKAYFLRQARPQTPQFPWLYDFGIAEVKEIYFDHLSQTVGTRRISDRSNAAPVRALGDHEIARQLLNSGAEKYAHRADQNAAENFKGDTGFPITPSSVGISRWSDTTTGRPRVKCDYCSSMVKEGGRSSNQMDCTEFGSTRRCKQCTSLGKPCTFTRDSRLFGPNNKALLAATYNPKKAHTAVQPLQAARFVHSF